MTGPVSLTHEDIARGAYEIYTHTGHQQGQCLQNWLAAEDDLRTRLKSREHTGAAPAPHDAATLSDDPRIALTEQSREVRHTRRGRNQLVDQERAKVTEVLTGRPDFQ